MRPFDALTENDKETIRAYLSLYGDTQCGPLETVLSYWNKSKTTLFKALGHNLRVSKTVVLPVDSAVIRRELEQIYYPLYIFSYADISFCKDKEQLFNVVKNDFIADVFNFVAIKNYCLSDLIVFSKLFLHKNLKNGYICSLDREEGYRFHDFKCTVKNGMKTIRAIQKVLKAINYPNLNLFENWKNTVNRISFMHSQVAELVISIHPLDFMTLSDNTCNWSSCMSWGNKGCYRGGTLEMMNSNLTVVAYLKSNKSFQLSLSEECQYDIPNKTWRCLFYVHKDILLSGKSYPYRNKNTTFMVLNELQQLLEKNLHWTYKFKNQLYRDLIQFGDNSNFYIRDYFDPEHDKKKEHHCIFIYTNGMYNDLVEDNSTEYWCCRNYVDHSIKLSASGPATCICCGEVIANREEIYDYDNLGKSLVCANCRIKKCPGCEQYVYQPKYHLGVGIGTFCSDKCLDSMYYLPGASYYHKTIRKEDFLSPGRTKYYALFVDTLSQEEIIKIGNDFLQINSYFDMQKWQDFLKTTYPESTLYVIPEGLAGYHYIDFNFFHRGVQKDGYYEGQNRRLKIFHKDSIEGEAIEQKIKGFLGGIPLREYLERKENYNS